MAKVNNFAICEKSPNLVALDATRLSGTNGVGLDYIQKIVFKTEKGGTSIGPKTFRRLLLPYA
jgi:hypothetical protein